MKKFKKGDKVIVKVTDSLKGDYQNIHNKKGIVVEESIGRDVGIKFNQKIKSGHTLGGLVEYGYGYYVQIEYVFKDNTQDKVRKLKNKLLKQNGTN